MVYAAGRPADATASVAAPASASAVGGGHRVKHPSPPPVPLPIREADDVELKRELNRLQVTPLPLCACPAFGNLRACSFTLVHSAPTAFRA